MEMMQFIEKLFARAKEAGFEACEAYVSSSGSFSAGVFKGDLISYESADRLGLGFRGEIGGRMGYASTQALDEDAVDQLVEGAKENAALITAEEKETLYAGDTGYAQLPLWSEALSAVSAADKIAMARRLEELTLQADARIEQTDGCEILYAAGETRIVNTLGLNVACRSNMLGGYVAPNARDGEKVGTGFSVFAALTPEEIDLEATAAEAAGRAVDSLYGESVPSGEMKVVLDPDAAAQLLATFAGVFSGENAQKGLSLLKGREGEEIAAACVTLTDDPHLPGSPASAPFDGEGVATKRHDVIASGVLKTLLHNRKTAAKQGAETTGNAVRSYNSSLGIAPTNFFVQPGEASQQALLKEMGEGLLITRLEGLHAGANPVSGDFSLSAEGHLVENGALSRPVKQITVAGNFYRLLREIEAVGSDLKFGMPGSSRFGSPSLRIKSLSVAGK